MIPRAILVCAVWIGAFIEGQAQPTRLDEFVPRVARILGTAIHPDGSPALGPIEVEPVTTGPSAVASVSRVDGSFETEKLPAGRYRVGVDLGINRQPAEAYGRTYYPGSPDALKAIQIEIAPGLPEPRILFTVPKLRPLVTLRGAVVYEDGSAAAGVDVFFSPVGGYSSAQLWTDSKGNYVQTVYGSVAYRIQSKSRDGKYESRSQVVQAADLVKPMLIVLRQAVVQTLDFTCAQFSFRATFSGRKGENLKIETPSAEEYTLHRTEEVAGHKFIDDSDHVIFVFASTQYAILNRGDVLVGCRAQIPVWLFKGEERP